MGKIILCIVLFISTYALSSLAVDHASMPMLTDPPSETETETEPAVSREDIVKIFSDSYQREGDPTIAIFWNRKFDDQLSQWEATHRRIREKHVVGNPLQPSSSEDTNSRGELDDSLKEQNKGERSVLISNYSERRANQQSRFGLGEGETFEFEAGYSQILIANKVKIIDRSAIMRIIERDNARESKTETLADYQKIETDALIGYADYLAEILFIKDNTADMGMAFMVTIKEVATGKIAAMFKSKGEVVKNEKVETQWVVTANGYKLEELEGDMVTPNDIGEQLAFETMHNLCKGW